MYYQKYLNNKTAVKPDKINLDDFKSKLDLIKSQQKTTIPANWSKKLIHQHFEVLSIDDTVFLFIFFIDYQVQNNQND